MSEIKLIISDFDGTLVDTFEANFLAYKKAFADCNLDLTVEQYRKCFGLNFEDLMHFLNIEDEKIKATIKNNKRDYYPVYFNLVLINTTLLSLIKAFKDSGGFTALVSTSSKSNLFNLLNHINAKECFSLILTGDDIKIGKPNPEIYYKALNHFNLEANSAIVFEDSEVGIEAARKAGLKYIKINNTFFNGNTGKRS